MGYPLKCVPLVLCTILATGCISVQEIDSNRARLDDLERRVSQALSAGEEAQADAAEAKQLADDAGADAVTANVRASEAVLISEKAVEIAEHALRTAENALAQARRRADTGRE